jgi:hypothetical protein
MNRKYQIIGTLFLLLIIAGCKKESGNLEPSNSDKNWFVVKNNPSDPLDNEISTIYKNTGIPIYYNDTIGSENRGTDVYGKPIIFYETLNVFYSLTGIPAGSHCVQSHNKADLMLGVALLRDRVIPLLPKAAYPKSFYLVDTVWTSAYSMANLYRGFKTTAVGQMNLISQMSDSDLATLAGSIAGGEIGSYLVSNYPADLQKFYAISNNIANVNMYGKYEGPYATPPATGNGEEFGFITVTLYSPQNYTTPTQTDDVGSYIVAIKTIKETDFKAQYANSPYVLQKYDLMKNLLAAHNL